MGPLQCKLTIFKDGEGRRKVRYDVIPHGPIHVDIVGDLCDDDLTKDTVKRLNRFISFSAIFIDKIDKNKAFCEHEDLQLLGQHLYHILFGGLTTLDGSETNKTLGEMFIETYQNFEAGLSDPAFRFRVTLIFEEGMDELAGYPWEFLYIPGPSDTGYFLAGQKAELILTRFVEKLGKPQSKPADKKLVILIAWSQPKELGPVDESDTIVAIKKLAEDIENKLKIQNIEVETIHNCLIAVKPNPAEKKAPAHPRGGNGISSVSLYGRERNALTTSRNSLRRSLKMKSINAT